jgi:serine/threonine protein kinase
MEPLRRWDPEQIGGYVLVGRLGAGAMGQVYLGRSAAGRVVAVKTIKVEFADNPDFRTRFAQEVSAARRVSGAFTAPVVAADPEADVPWLATAYVPAPSLSTLVRSCGPLAVPAVRWLAAGCAEALESIHSAGLVHRDLKPSNVLVSLDGPRVIDFGVARAAERIQLTVTRGAVGTPAYMAPEQARDTRQATTASDVYSLGATMLFAVTGHGPYQGDTAMDVLVQLGTEPPDLSDLPGELTDIVVACLERDPRKRPASTSVLAHLAPGIGVEADARELGPVVLSLPALALIAEYRRDPRPSDQPLPETGEDDTFGSQPAASGARGSPAAGQEPPRGAGSRSGKSGRPRPGTDGIRPGPGGRRALVALASALAAAALIAAGAGIGAYLAGRPAGAAAGPLGAGGSPSATAGGSGAGSSPGATAGTTGGGNGPPLAGPGPPRGGLPPRPGGRPGIVVLQPFGDGYTVFVVQGAGWPPHRTLTVALAGIGTSSVHPAADSAGNFSYAIDQGHEFFKGMLPPGAYRVVVTAADGARATATFLVNHR